MFLLVEIDRAEIVPDDARDIDSIVTMGSWVTYWTNWGVRRQTVQLVWPGDRTSDPAQVSILSNLGAALVGLRVGDQMPYFEAGCMDVVRIEGVDRFNPNNDPLAPLLRVSRSANDDGDDPGPTAA
jgi:regulator of nucleoside diphosphate kinase